MDKIKEKIAELLKAGKSNEEIVVEIAKMEEAQSKGMKAADILKEIKSLEASEKALKEFEALKAQELEEEKIAANVKKVLEKMPAFSPKFKDNETYKHFNPETGKIEEKKYESESQSQLQKLLMAAFVDKDAKSAKSISDEIGQETERMKRGLSRDVKTPLYSDATTGSYMIPTEVNMQILALTYQKSALFNRLNKAVVGYNSKVYPIMIDGTFAFITDETTQLGDKTQTVSNPSIDMKRYGGLAYLSNTLLQYRGSDLTTAFMNSVSSMNAKFIDLMVPAASVTTNSDLFNGIFFDANTAYVAAANLSAITSSTLTTLLNTLDPSCDPASTVFFANRKIRSAFGLLENSNGAFVFPQFMTDGTIEPTGVPFLLDSQIGSALNHAASAGSGANRRTGGTADIIAVADLSKIVVGMGDLRIEASEHFKFDYDQIAFRMVGQMGCKVLSSSSTAGAVAAIQQLNAA
ncbi:phage major capsid protein [Polynucleobacter sp.]|uniref:phage major capsid protein n=1 Tax=Polynucleobacter sp. TaxID=2029855 RepID=UPI003F6A20AA